MAPVLLAGDFVFASKTSYGFKIPGTSEVYFSQTPNRGDLIVFRKNSKIYIKRVLALPKEEVEFTNSEYRINATPCTYTMFQNLSDETGGNKYAIYSEKCGDAGYNIIKATDPTTSPQMLKIKLKDSQLFVASDFRGYENDLELAEVVSFDQIIGKPLFVWMSYSSTQDFISDTLGIRWSRIMTKL